MVDVHATAQGWAISGYDLTRFPDEWTVWFIKSGLGASVALTVRSDGEVIGFEVHAGDERGAPLEGGSEAKLGAEFGVFAELPRVVNPLVPKHPTPLTARMLRDIALGELASIARNPMRVLFFDHDEAFAELDQHVEHHADVAIDSARMFRQEVRRPGRRGRPDRYYAGIAVAYERWSGMPRSERKPLRSLASELYLSESGLHTALQRARKRGLLTEAPRKPDGQPGGVAGGRATDKARRLLEEGDADGLD